MTPKAEQRQDLGFIVCRHCSRIIDTIDTDRVIVYYMSCKDERCRLMNESQTDE